MSTLTKPETTPEAVAVTVTDDTLSVDLDDGRTISVPVAWFPRLRHATPGERSNFELGKNGIHWPALDEDIPVAGLLNGEKSGESLQSIRRWLAGRERSSIVNGNKIEGYLMRFAIYRNKNPISQKLLCELVSFVKSRFNLLPRQTGTRGHLVYDPNFLHIEIVGKNKPSLTVNLTGQAEAYLEVRGIREMISKPRPGQTRLKVSKLEQLDTLLQAVDKAHSLKVGKSKKWRG